MLKAGAKRRLSRMECSERKRVNADKDAELFDRLDKIQKLEAQLLESQAKVVHLDRTTALLG